MPNGEKAESEGRKGGWIGNGIFGKGLTELSGASGFSLKE